MRGVQQVAGVRTRGRLLASQRLAAHSPPLTGAPLATCAVSRSRRAPPFHGAWACHWCGRCDVPFRSAFRGACSRGSLWPHPPDLGWRPCRFPRPWRPLVSLLVSVLAPSHGRQVASGYSFPGIGPTIPSPSELDSLRSLGCKSGLSTLLQDTIQPPQRDPVPVTLQFFENPLWSQRTGRGS